MSGMVTFVMPVTVRIAACSIFSINSNDAGKTVIETSDGGEIVVEDSIDKVRREFIAAMMGEDRT